MNPRLLGHAAKGLPAAVVLIVLSSGCSETAGVRVQTQYGPGVKFTGLGDAYCWASRDEPRGQDSRQVENPQINELIVRGVEARLKERGFIRQTQGIPDFWVDYRVATKELGDKVYGRTYEKGWLILDVVDPDDDRIIWRGSANVNMYEPVTPDVTEKRITYALNEMFKTFPARQGPDMPPAPKP